MKKMLLLPSLILFAPLTGYSFNYTLKEVSPTKIEVTATFSCKGQEYLYKDSLIPSVDRSEVTLSSFTTKSKVRSFYDETYKKNKDGYTGTIQFKGTATLKSEARVAQAQLHFHFMVNSDKKPQEQTIPLHFSLEIPTPPSDVKAAIPVPTPAQSIPVNCEPQQPSLLGNLFSKIVSYVSTFISYSRDSLSSLFKTTGSKPVRALVALLLGLLLSLTPCIYPMIPITIGILQAQGTASPSRNFLLALSYTLGISLTFAVLGFIAAMGSCVFGELQGNPLLLIPLSLMLFYFGLTMFDVVQLPIPRWLIPKGSKQSGGSLQAAFLFGALSGTIASPCLSPGLILLLNYVATITQGSIAGYAEGFMLLFIFGVGSSIPLLIIGTFSGSLALLPKAGAWMNEVKKIVGILLISMGLYHLSHVESLFPWYLFVWVVVLTFMGLSIYFLVSVKQSDSRTIWYYKNGLAVLLMLVAAAVAVQGIKAGIQQKYPEVPSTKWYSNYQEALEEARSRNTLLFIDIGASYCSACKALDTRIFNAPQMQGALGLFSLLKIEADTNIAVYEEVKALFGTYILGYPTYLIIDPTTQKVVKKWSVELDDMTLQAIEETFKKEVAMYHGYLNNSRAIIRNILATFE